MNAVLEAFSFLVGMVFNLYAMLLAVRFIMQLFRADYYNPLAQFVVKVTDPVLRPVRKIVPSIKTYDTSSLLLAFVVLLLKLVLLKLLQTDILPIAGKPVYSHSLSYGALFMVAIVDVIHLLFNVFIFAMFIQAILSWFPNPQTDSIRNLLSGLTEPILRPIRKRVPPIGGLDLSILIGIVVLFFLQILVTGSLLAPFIGR